MTCPQCGNRFALEDKVVDQLRSEWEDLTEARIRKELRSQLRPRLAREAEKRAKAQLSTELLEQEETVKDRDRQIAKLNAEIKRLHGAVSTDRAQQLGRAREESLAEALQAHFPEDSIRLTPRGRAGADVTQVIYDSHHKKVGSILWEVKRAKGWNRAWITKLREDRKKGRHSVGVLVSDARPARIGALGQIEDVWVSSFDLAPAIAAILREVRLRIASVKATQSGKDDLKGSLYDYVTGGQFGGHLRSIVEAASNLQDSLEADRRASHSRWAKQEQSIQSVVRELVESVAEIQGLGVSDRAISLPQDEIAALPMETD